MQHLPVLLVITTRPEFGADWPGEVTTIILGRLSRSEDAALVEHVTGGKGLPPELMEYGSVGIGLLKGSKEPQAATDFIKYMADPANVALLKKGFMYPPLK